MKISGNQVRGAMVSHRGTPPSCRPGTPTRVSPPWSRSGPQTSPASGRGARPIELTCATHLPPVGLEPITCRMLSPGKRVRTRSRMLPSGAFHLTGTSESRRCHVCFAKAPRMRPGDHLPSERKRSDRDYGDCCRTYFSPRESCLASSLGRADASIVPAPALPAAGAAA